MNYVNEVEIRRVTESDDPIIRMPFNEVFDDEFYTVVDKELIGQMIGRIIVDDNIDIDEEYRVVYDLIDEYLVNQLVNDVFEFVEEYAYNNG